MQFLYSNYRLGQARPGARGHARRRAPRRGGRASRSCEIALAMVPRRAALAMLAFSLALTASAYHENFETLEQFEQFVDAYPSALIGLFTNCDDDAACAALRQLKDRTRVPTALALGPLAREVLGDLDVSAWNVTFDEDSLVNEVVLFPSWGRAAVQDGESAPRRRSSAGRGASSTRRCSR